MNKTHKLILHISMSIVMILILALTIINILGLISNRTETYLIQDIHNWCCRNINETISPTGDNCSNVIDNIYGGEC